MICRNCGAEIADNCKFCTKCGTPTAQPAEETTAKATAEPVTEVTEEATVEPAAEASVNTEEPAGKKRKEKKAKAPKQPKEPKQPKAPKEPKEKKPKNILAIIIAALIVLLAVGAGLLIFFNLKKTEVNLTDYLTFEAEGYDGFGTVTATFDKDQFVKDYKGKIKPSKKLEDMVRDDKQLKAIYKEGDYKLSKERDVCELFADIYTSKGAFKTSKNDEPNKYHNGDVLEYQWNCDTKDKDTDDMVEFAAKAFRVNVTLDDIEYTVEGLDEIETFDPFSLITIEYSGVAPNGYAQLTSYPDDNGLYYSLDKNSGLSNGDEITVRAEYAYGSQEEYIEQYKKIPETMEMTMVVDSIDEYVTDAGALTEEDIESIKQMAETRIADLSKNFSSEVSLNSATFETAYMLVNKEDTTWSDANLVILAYKLAVDITFDDHDYDDTVEFYYPVCYYGVMKTGSGELHVDENNAWSTYDSVSFKQYYGPKSYNYKNFYFYGYESMSELEDELNYDYLDEYDCTVIAEGDGVTSDIGSIDEAVEEADADYILPDSSTKKLSMSDLEGLDEGECRIARNEIYARHGRRFDDEELQKYFDDKAWYEGKIDADDFKENELSDIEMANRDLIVEYEKKKGYR